MTNLDYILTLNGICPEGTQVEKHLAGGCVKCAKLRATKEFKCGGATKKRISKKQEGGQLKKAINLSKKPEISKNDTIHVDHNRKIYAVSDKGHEAGYKYPLRAYTFWTKDEKARYHTKFDKTHGDGV